jgi:hypothetical protein
MVWDRAAVGAYCCPICNCWIVGILGWRKNLPLKNAADIGGILPGPSLEKIKIRRGVKRWFGWKKNLKNRNKLI